MKAAFLFIPLVILVLFTTKIRSQTIELNISNIRTNKGNINIAVYKSSDDFENRTAFKKIIISKANQKADKLTYTFNIPAGTYGIAMADDENASGKLDKNFFGIPSEGFGFSNYYHTSMSQPKFSSFKFILKQNKTQKVAVKLRYL